MFELLLYANLTCQDANSILRNINKHENLHDYIKVELVETVKESAPDCNWDAND